jgi:transcriptional regulator with XRE-family HTH domain
LNRQTMMADDWKQRLLDAVEKDGRSDRAISLAAGLGPSFVNELRRTEKEPGIQRVLKLAAELNVSLATLFLGREDITPQDEELLQLARQTSAEEREAILTLWRGKHPSRE